jgi:hypothetical protein
MIPYEELVAALDGYNARGRAPLSQSERAAPIAIGAAAPRAAARASGAPSFVPPSPSRPQPAALPPEVDFGHYDEAHDPDLPALGGHEHEEDSTHVGAMPLSAPPSHAEHDEIDLGDVLTDDEV